MRRNRLLYGALTIGVALAALLYGDSFMYMTLYVLVAMPLISLILAMITLFGLAVSQDTASKIVIKGEPNQYFLVLHNKVKFGFGSVRCLFLTEQFAIETDASDRLIDIRPFKGPYRLPVDFIANYRGMFQMGLKQLEILDFLGLFRIRRNMRTVFEIVAYPQVKDLEHMEFAMHLLSKAPANLTIAQEDYEDYTDVRPYELSDPIKKVHWKLTAKRGEWIVKNFQSSVLNSMAILLDAEKRPLFYENSIKIEDIMIEYAVAITRFCLRQQMPADFFFGRNIRESGRHIGDFDTIYNVAANLVFSPDEFSVLDALDEHLNETSHNVNVVILTSVLSMPLYDRILNAIRFGHYIAVMYFVPESGAIDPITGPVFERMQASGINCVKIQ